MRIWKGRDGDKPRLCDGPFPYIVGPSRMKTWALIKGRELYISLKRLERAYGIPI